MPKHWNTDDVIAQLTDAGADPDATRDNVSDAAAGESVGFRLLSFELVGEDKWIRRVAGANIRYAGVYSGPSYGNPFEPSYEGFTSLQQARDRYAERQETSGTWRLDVTSLEVTRGEITGVSEDSTYWPGTSPEDKLEIHVVINGMVSSEPLTRFVTGPRGGIIRENFS